MEMLVIGSRPVAVPFAGHGVLREHRSGRWGVDVDGLRLLAAQVPDPGLVAWGTGDLAGPALRVVDALSIRFGWVYAHRPDGYWSGFVPSRQAALAVELDEAGALVCLPVVGEDGVSHDCPPHPRALIPVLKHGPRNDPAWETWLDRQAKADRSLIVDAVGLLGRALGVAA